MSKFCPNCGHENRDVAIFCGNCGNRLIASNFSTNLRDTGSSTTSKPKTTLMLQMMVFLYVVE